MTATAASFYDIHSELVKGLPTFEPLDPRETADMLHLGDDPVIVQQIAEHLQSALSTVEIYLQTAFATRSAAVLYLDEFPCWEVEWRFPPLNSITSIVYLDSDNVSQTLSSALYRVDTTGKPGRITPVYGQIWPCTYPTTRAITITGNCGYTDPSLVPPIAKSAMRAITKMLYDGGGIMCEDGLQSVFRMLDQLRWGGYQ